MLDAYENGQQIDDLPAADLTVTDKIIEVYDPTTGASQQMQLKDAVDMANAPYFGRVWNTANATPVAQSWVGSLEFGKQLAGILGLGCYLVQADHTRRKLDPSNHYLFANGETAKLDGSMGHYQWGWGKPWYYATWLQGTLRFEVVSLQPIKGQYSYLVPIATMSADGHACYNRTTGALCSLVNTDANYRGGNNTSDWDDTYRSLLGKPVTNLSTSAFKTAAEKVGTGWFAGLGRMLCAIAILEDVILGTHNHQTAFNATLDADGLHQGGLGAGVTNFSNWSTYNSYSPMIPCGVCAEKGDLLGVISYDVPGADDTTYQTVSISCFYGLVHAGFGHLWRWCVDEMAMANEDGTMTHYMADDLTGTWDLSTGTGMSAYSTMPKGEGYEKNVSLDNFEAFPTIITGGSESTYFPDYGRNTSGITSGVRAVARGAGADPGGQSGSFAVTVSYALSDAAAYYGSPLCETEGEWTLQPVYTAAA